MKNTSALIFSLAFLLFFLISCKAQQKQISNENSINSINSITYSFGDSSVPPEDHRSYSITATQSSVRIVVDSYGDIISDSTFTITQDQFSMLVNSLKTNKIRSCKNKEDNEYCDGGTSETISYYGTNTEAFTGTVYHCGGKSTGTLCGEITNFKADIKGLIPDISALMKR